MHRSTVYSVLASGLLCLVGCGDRPRPLVSGELESVTIWERPVQRPGELGENEGSTMRGGRVDVYPDFIVVTPPKGPSTLSPHGWYTNLRFVKE
jgi:hypothetical protein